MLKRAAIPLNQVLSTFVQSYQILMKVGKTFCSFICMAISVKCHQPSATFVFFDGNMRVCERETHANSRFSTFINSHLIVSIKGYFTVQILIGTKSKNFGNT